MEIKNGIMDIPKDQYHKNTTHYSHTALERFRESVPYFYGLYIARTIPFPPATDALDFGSAFHTALLEPEKFGQEVAVAPKIDKRTKEGKACWEAFNKVNQGKIIIDLEELALIEAMRKTAWDHPRAHEFLEVPGFIETPFGWTDPGTGLLCKIRPDKVCNEMPAYGSTIIDLKTAADPKPKKWLRDATNFGYHRQDAFYRMGMQHSIDLPCRFVFIVIGKSPPHEVVVYEFKGRKKELGERQVTEDLAKLSVCKTFNQWGSQYLDHIIEAEEVKPWEYEGE